MEPEVLNLWISSGNTVIFVTHDLEEAISLSDEIFLLSAGPGSRLVGRFPFEVPNGNSDNTKLMRRARAEDRSSARELLQRFHRFVGKQCSLRLTVFRDRFHDKRQITIKIVDISPFSRQK